MNKIYRERFLRSLGIMDERSLEQLRSMKVAVAGLGLGGSIFINLVRLGIENFHVADPDVYERTNINRQRLAKESSVGARKDETLIKEAREINPDIKIKAFREGVQAHNMDEFLDGVDWIVESIDVFAMNEKLGLHEKASQLRLPIASTGALGFGCSVVVFAPGTPSFAELTGMRREYSPEQNLRLFARFICPEIPTYMADQLQLAFNKESHIPFVVPGVEIAAALTVTELAKHVLNLGEKILAPEGIYIDPVQMTLERYHAFYGARELHIPTPARKAS